MHLSWYFWQNPVFRCLLEVLKLGNYSCFCWSYYVLSTTVLNDKQLTIKSRSTKRLWINWWRIVHKQLYVFSKYNKLNISKLNVYNCTWKTSHSCEVVHINIIDCIFAMPYHVSSLLWTGECKLTPALYKYIPTYIKYLLIRTCVKSCKHEHA